MQLTVVIPVYNEEEIIEKVVSDWHEKLESLKIDFEIHAYNDGSKDNTLAKLIEAANKYPRLKVFNKKNTGHGPTILIGYKNAESDWIFQIDSDNEMDSKYFEQIWNEKDNYDFLVGSRAERVSPLPRKIITLFSRLIVKIFYGNGVNDVNSPYRLYRASAFKNAFDLIPENTFAPNVILSGYAALKKLRIYETPIPCKLRQTGEVSIKKWKLVKAAFKSMVQTVKFRFIL
jgi:glycosyltransferase involved in cell wall biosynthesis